MKRLPILGMLLLAPAMAMLFVTAGCNPPAKTPTGGGDGAKTKTGGDGGGDKTKGGEVAGAPDATVTGIVTFDGDPPAAKVNPAIALHQDAKNGYCGKEANQHQQVWIIGKDKGVANVVVSLAPPKGKKFKKLDDALLKEYKHSVILDQPFCNYVPHVVALYADYQPLVAKNDAKTNHNVKIEAGDERGGTKNYNLAPGKDSGPIMLNGGGEGVIDASCQVHSWMNAKIALFNNPYFAVSDEDGKFTIKNVPVGEKLKVYRWHESDPKKVEVKEMEFTKGDNKLEFKIK
jgi:hypothetical protein